MPISRSKKFVSDYMLDALLRHFEKITELTAGRLNYKRHDFNELYEILPDAFAVKPAISRSEAIGLFSSRVGRNSAGSR